MSWWKKVLSAILIAVSGYEVGQDSTKTEKINSLEQQIQENKQITLSQNQNNSNISIFHIIGIIVLLAVLSALYTLIKNHIKYSNHRRIQPIPPPQL